MVDPNTIGIGFQGHSGGQGYMSIFELKQFLNYSQLIPPSYLISTDGTTTFATNGTTGIIDFKGTDAFTVIQTGAINALTKGMIFIKSGTYNLSAPLDTSDKPIFIMGENRFNTILSHAGDVIRILNLTGTVGLSAQQGVSNITLNGVNNTGTGLGLSRIFRCSFDDLIIQNCNIGIHFDQTIENTIKNPYISACTTGMVFDTVVSTTSSFNDGNVTVGGEINNGNPGVLIYGTASSNKFFGTVIEGAQTTQVIIKTAFLTANNQDAVPNATVLNGCWFETGGVVAPVHIDIQKDAASTNYPWSNVITNSFFAADANYTAINNPGARNIFSSNHLSGPVGQTETIAVSGNDNIIAFNSVAFNTLTITNTGSRNLLKTNFGYTTFLTVLSGTFLIDSATTLTVNIAHGLALTPNVQDCSLTVAVPTAAFTFDSLYIVSTNATNVVASIRITTAAAAGNTAKIALRVGKP